MKRTEDLGGYEELMEAELFRPRQRCSSFYKAHLQQQSGVRNVFLPKAPLRAVRLNEIICISTLAKMSLKVERMGTEYRATVGPLLQLVSLISAVG